MYQVVCQCSSKRGASYKLTTPASLRLALPLFYIWYLINYLPYKVLYYKLTCNSLRLILCKRAGCLWMCTCARLNEEASHENKHALVTHCHTLLSCYIRKVVNCLLHKALHCKLICTCILLSLWKRPAFVTRLAYARVNQKESQEKQSLSHFDFLPYT